MRGSPRQRLAAKTVAGPDGDGCLIFVGTTDRNGYGRLKVGGRAVRAHRLAWELAWSRPVPDGLQLDHLCRRRSCVNPDHLEPATNRENITRGANSALNPAKTSRFAGVYWDRRDQRWVARIFIDGRNRRLGSFADDEAAGAAYARALADLGEAQETR